MSPPRTVVLVRRPAGATRRRTTGRRPVRRRRSRPTLKPAQWWPLVLVALVVVVGLAWDADGDDTPTDSCTLPASGVTLTVEQIANARAIAQVAWDRGLPERAGVIALATAMQESHLSNLDYGDRDSLGLFQQRPSQGWGTPEQVQDPVYAAGKFYDHLVQYPGWDTGDLTTVADGIQRSAHPLAYRKWETMAQELASAVSDDKYPCA
jgi:hypothetical protein